MRECPSDENLHRVILEGAVVEARSFRSNNDQTLMIPSSLQTTSVPPSGENVSKAGALQTVDEINNSYSRSDQTLTVPSTPPEASQSLTGEKLREQTRPVWASKVPRSASDSNSAKEIDTQDRQNMVIRKTENSAKYTSA